VIFAYGLTAFTWAFPLPIAHLTASLGAHNASGVYFEREYTRNPTDRNLYNTLDRYIIAQNHRKIVEFGDKFYALDEANSTKIINTVNAEMSARAGKNRINLVSWANESSRINGSYTIALIRTNKTTEALLQLNDWLLETPNVEQPNHAFIRVFLETDDARSQLESYVTELEKVLDTPGRRNIFAYDFLFYAHWLLGDEDEAKKYMRSFNEHPL